MTICGGIFDLPGKEARLKELRRLQESPELWDDPDEAARVNREASHMEETLSEVQELAEDYENIAGVFELLEQEGVDENDPEFAELADAVRDLGKRVERHKMLALLSGENDDAPAIVTIHAGAGGTESHDWVDMLSRMYFRWAEQTGHSVKVLSEMPGEVAGTKSITFVVEGKVPYGLLKSEHGVHRLVRISPFDSAGRRHTSFAAVDVIPQIEQDDTVRINESDLRIDTYRASSAGGQHVNKTSSAVRITHIPTGIVVSCQNERSQHLNREVAMKMLRSKLKAILRQEQKEEIEELRGAVKDIAWGNQIRSYVLQPYQLIKDLRTGYETGNTQRVLDGGLEPFILEYLKYEKKEQEAMNNRAK